MDKIFDVTSDLHSSLIYRNNKEVFWQKWVLKQERDYLIIAGDINEHFEFMRKTLDDIIENTTYKKIIITFWNHDIRTSWSEDFPDSINKYEFLVDYFHWYKDKIHVIDKEDFLVPESNFIVTGNMWWYNYSIWEVNKKYLEEDFWVNFDRMAFWRDIYNDRNYVDFNEKIKWNLEFSDYLENKLIERLEKIKKDYDNKEIIAISHIKPSNELEKDSIFYITYNEEDWYKIREEWLEGVSNYKLDKLYWNAFFVNNNLSKIYSKYWVKYAIYWHTHYKWKSIINWVKYVSNAYWYNWTH